MFIGINHGYFHELGLEVESVPFSIATEMAAPLIAGQIDIANADPSSAFLNAAARGAQIRFVADGSHSESGHSSVVLVIRKDLIDSGQVKDFSDLKGLRLSGVFKGSAPDMYLHQYMAEGNLDDSDVDVQYLSFAASLPAMASKQLDGAIEVEPLATAAVDQGIAVAWKRKADVFGPAQGTVIMFSPSMAAHRQDVGRRFMAAYVRAIRDYADAVNQGRDMASIVGLLARNTDVKDLKLFDRMQLPAFDVNGQMNLKSLHETQQWFVDHNYVPSAVDLSNVIDTSYLDYALAQDGKR